MNRREFIALLGGTMAAAWPLAARAQQPAMPVIGFIRDGSAQGEARWVGGFHKGLSDTGVRRGQKRDGRVPLAGRQIRSLAGTVG
jgi:hypothetical protein